MSARSKQEKTPPASVEEPSFESALGRLEEVVDQLERGDLELEAARTVFEQGVRLSKQCAERLDAAEQRIEVLTEESGGWLARPFEPPGEVDEGEEDG